MRIVSLLAGATEMIAELGCLDQVVGCSHECDYPPQVRQLPVVSSTLIDTSTSSVEIDRQVKEIAHQKETTEPGALQALSVYTIDASMLQKLQPDVIFTQTQCDVCAVSQSDVEEALQQSIGTRPRIVALAPYRLQDIWEDVQRVGTALGRTAEARTVIASYKQRLAQLKEQTSRYAEQRGSRPRVAMLEWLDPLMAAANWVPELVEYAGGESIFGTVGEHSPWLTWEALRDADPDVIVLSPCGYSIERTREDLPLLQQHPIWGSLRAVKEGRVAIVDGNAYVNRSGPRLVESAEILGRILWGEQSNIAVPDQSYVRLEAEQQ